MKSQSGEKRYELRVSAWSKDLKVTPVYIKNIGVRNPRR